MKKDYKKDVDFVFEQNPDLARIGTKEQYEKYLETIFPGSKIKEIVYHGSRSKTKFEKFNLKFGGMLGRNFGKGIYVAQNRHWAKEYDDKKRGVICLITDVKNPLITCNHYNDFHGVYSIPWGEKITEHSDFDSVINYEYLDRDDLKKINKYLLEYTGEKENNGLPAYQKNIRTNPEIREIVIPNPSQVRILGSKKDKKDFYKFVHGENKSKTLEKIVSGIFIFSVLVGLFLSAGNLTGNIIGISGTGGRFFGIILTLFGISGFFIHKKLSK